MNWIFETYSNVYRTAMWERPPHHRPGSLTAEQKQRLKRGNGKFHM